MSSVGWRSLIFFAVQGLAKAVAMHQSIIESEKFREGRTGIRIFLIGRKEADPTANRVSGIGFEKAWR
jgi:hypothetical protein